MDAIIGFLQANVVILGFIVGLAVKYLPALKAVSNKWIPYLNTLVALLLQIFGPAEAHAGTAILGLGGGTFLAHILGAGWSAIQSALIYEVFGRHLITAPKA